MKELMPSGGGIATIEDFESVGMTYDTFIHQSISYCRKNRFAFRISDSIIYLSGHSTMQNNPTNVKEKHFHETYYNRSRHQIASNKFF